MTIAMTSVGASWATQAMLTANPVRIELGTGNANPASTEDTDLENSVAGVTGVPRVDVAQPRVLKCAASFPAGTFAASTTIYEVGWFSALGGTLIQRVTYDTTGYQVNQNTIVDLEVGVQQRPTVDA